MRRQELDADLILMSLMGLLNRTEVCIEAFGSTKVPAMKSRARDPLCNGE